MILAAVLNIGLVLTELLTLVYVHATALLGLS